MFFATSIPSSLRHPQASNPALERFLGEARRATHSPGSTFSQDATTFTLHLDVPGIAKDQLRISIEGAVVRITSLENAPRSYRFAYEFPQDIDATASQAKLDNGVLTLTLAKKVAAPQANDLAIH